MTEIALSTLLVVLGGAGAPCREPPPPEVRLARGVRVVAGPDPAPSDADRGALDSLGGACFVPRPLQPLPHQEDSP